MAVMKSFLDHLMPDENYSFGWLPYRAVVGKQSLTFNIHHMDTQGSLYCLCQMQRVASCDREIE